MNGTFEYYFHVNKLNQVEFSYLGICRALGEELTAPTGGIYAYVCHANREHVIRLYLFNDVMPIFYNMCACL